MKDVGWFWDHADQRHVMAHDAVISHDVCPSRAHYSIERRRLLRRFAHVQQRHDGITMDDIDIDQGEALL